MSHFKFYSALDYINEIDDVKDDEDRRRIKDVLDNIIDYTQSHFTFEESLQEEADYKYRVPHKRVHDLFMALLHKHSKAEFSPIHSNLRHNLGARST